jgi:hypothetical protein
MTDLDSFIIDLVDKAPYGITRRGIFYKVVSAGFYPSTDEYYYKRKLGPVLKKLRQREQLNEEKILDNTRIRKEPYVFGDPSEFLSDVESSYKKDLWEDQSVHLEVFSEKDAMSSVLSSIINKYRITYNMIRGFVSEPLVYRIVNDWLRVPDDKEIHVLYVGDHGASGMSIEDNIKRKIRFRLRFAADDGDRDDDDDDNPFNMLGDFINVPKCDLDRIVWRRLAATQNDMERNPKCRLPLKISDRRTAGYRRKLNLDHGMEVDAIDNAEIVSRLEKSVLKRIDKEAWDVAKQVELEEREKLKTAISDVSKQF